MANLLQDKLRPASFRGIPFQVENTDMDGGRRTQTHEYPQRDKPFSQDMGRATRNINFDAYVVGFDYVEQANALLGAMEAYGPGALIHPWFGTLKVNVTGFKVAFDRGLGQARFSLQFVEAGLLEFPSGGISSASLSRTAAAGLQSASNNNFAKAFAVLGFVNNVTEQALSTYGKVLTFLGNPAFALASLTGYSTLPGNLSSLAALFNQPFDLVQSFSSLLNLSSKARNSGVTGGDATALPVVRGLIRMAVDPTLAQPAKPDYTTKTTEQIWQNNAAILANTRQLLLVQAVGLSSFVDCKVYDDTLALKNELAAALDDETLLATDDNLYQTLMTARAAMWQDLTERSRNSARLTTLTPTDIMPMLAIAYDYYGDASRDSEMIARNKIRHPGFVQVDPLLVLSA